MDYTFTSNTESLPIGKMYLELIIKGCTETTELTAIIEKGFRLTNIGAMTTGVISQVETDFQATSMNFKIWFPGGHADKNILLPMFSTNVIKANLKGTMDFPIYGPLEVTYFSANVDMASINAKYLEPALEFDIVDGLAKILENTLADKTYYTTTMLHVVREQVPLRGLMQRLLDDDIIPTLNYDDPVDRNLDPPLYGIANYINFQIRDSTRAASLLQLDEGALGAICYTHGYLFGGTAFLTSFGELFKALLLNLLSYSLFRPGNNFVIVPYYYDNSPTMDLSDDEITNIKYNPINNHWEHRFFPVDEWVSTIFNVSTESPTVLNLPWAYSGQFVTFYEGAYAPAIEASAKFFDYDGTHSTPAREPYQHIRPFIEQMLSKVKRNVTVKKLGIQDFLTSNKYFYTIDSVIYRAKSMKFNFVKDFVEIELSEVVETFEFSETV